MMGWHAIALPSAALAVLLTTSPALAQQSNPATGFQWPWAQRGEVDWGTVSLSTGLNYSTGKYGQATSTDILYVPLTGKLEADAWTFKLTVPWVSVTGAGNVVQGSGVVGAAGTQRTTESGLGDVVASVGRTVYESAETGTAVDVSAKVKFGTGDEVKGLGTGKNDYSFAIEPAQRWGAITLFGTLGYKVVGDPPGSNLDNVVFASVGGAGQIVDSLSVGLSLDGQTRSSASAPGAQRDITAFASHRLNDDWKSQIYVSRGLSEASPDWSGGAMATFRF